MPDPFFRSGVAGIDRVTLDAGLREHMRRVFGYMAGGLALTGLLAWIASRDAFGPFLVQSSLRWVFMIAPLGFIMAMNFSMATISRTGLKILFWLFCGTMGLSMGTDLPVLSPTPASRARFSSRRRRSAR